MPVGCRDEVLLCCEVLYRTNTLQGWKSTKSEKRGTTNRTKKMMRRARSCSGKFDSELSIISIFNLLQSHDFFHWSMMIWSHSAKWYWDSVNPNTIYYYPYNDTSNNNPSRTCDFQPPAATLIILHQQNGKVNTLPCNDYNFHLDYHLGETLFRTRWKHNNSVLTCLLGQNRHLGDSR